MEKRRRGREEVREKGKNREGKGEMNRLFTISF